MYFNLRRYWKLKMKVKSDHLSRIESQLDIILPSAYKEFYARCERRIPKKLIGTDLRHEYHELNNWAVELLKENQQENFLEKKDFVFMMHQGYIFWYFSADGSENPMVHEFSEADNTLKKIVPLQEFLNQF